MADLRFRDLSVNLEEDRMERSLSDILSDLSCFDCPLFLGLNLYIFSVRHYSLLPRTRIGETILCTNSQIRKWFLAHVSNLVRDFRHLQVAAIHCQHEFIYH